MSPATTGPAPSRVDFSYAFATPHRLTVALPDSSDKTLLDLYPNYLRIAWTYDNLLNKPLAAFVTPRTEWELHLRLTVDEQPLAQSTWRRAEGWLPVLMQQFTSPKGSVVLTVAGGATATLVRILLTNHDTQPHRFALTCAVPGNWAGQNPAWVDPTAPADALLAGWRERADRVLVCAVGVEACSAPGATTLGATWTVAAGATRVAWLVRPYRAYAADLPALRNQDWGTDWAAALQTWRTLIGRASHLQCPDPLVADGFLACLADLFIMREPIADGYLATSPGTECYRAPNPFEAGTAAVALDQLGYHAEAAAGFQVSLDLQEADGDWSEPKGWTHQMWGASGFKAWVGMEHYRLTRDQAYLEALFARLQACSRWQERQRARTRVLENGQRPLTYGLLPRGMGDAGLMDGQDLYGVFLPHNIMAVYADKMAVEAATLLGREDDVPELQRNYETALADLRTSMDRGAIVEDGYRWLPGVPGKTCGSRFGVLYAAFPFGLLPPDHELISGTIRRLQDRISPGGLPIHLGWQPEGLWVAITLDNLAEVLLQRHEGDAAINYLYATLNHGTPLFTWCEERGQQPGASDCSGDRQHLWTPVAVVRFLRDAFVMEDGGVVHLGRGLDRGWVGSGQPVGVSDAATHFGRVSFAVRYVAEAGCLRGTVELAPLAGPAPVVLHLRLPPRLRAIAAEAPGATLTDGATQLSWAGLTGRVTFQVTTAG